MSVKESVSVKNASKMVEVLEPYRAFESSMYPVTSNWASKMGHACERYLYHRRKDWEKAVKKDWKGIGERGNLIADWWKRRMMAKGFTLIHGELPLSDELSKKFKIGGRIDGRIGWEGIKPVLYEFKTMSGSYYDKINTYNDLMDSKAEWIRGYPAQIQLYLLSFQEDAGIFVLCKPETLEWKTIVVYRDDGYCEWLLGRAARVNKACDNDLPPDRIPFSSTCMKCEMRMVCLPDMKNEGMEQVDDDYLLQLTQERHQMKPYRDRYEECDDEVKELAKARGKDFILSGEFAFTIKKSQGTRLDTKLLPDEVRKAVTVPTEKTTVDIRKLGE